MRNPGKTYPIAMQAIQILGGEDLNKKFILYRTLHDVLSKIRKATQEELNYRDEENNTLLHFAASTNDGLPIVKLLLKRGLDPTAQNKHGLRAAKYAKNVAILTLLLTQTSKRETLCANS